MPQSKSNNLTILHPESSGQSTRSLEELNKLIIENAPNGIALLDPKGKWLHVNDALCLMLAYKREEFLGTDFQSLTHPDDRTVDTENFEKLLSGEMDSVVVEKRYRHKDGQHIWTRSYLNSIRDMNGELEYFSLQIIDITAEKKSQEALNDVQAQLQGLVQNAPLLITLKKTDGSYILVNDVGEDNTGIPVDEILGKTAHDILNVETANRVAERDKKILELGEPVSEEIAEGDKIFFDTGFLIRDKENNPAYIGNYSIDITERKRQEQRVAHNEELSRITIDLAPIGVTLADVDGRWLRVNKAFATMLGYTQDELLEIDFRTITHPDDLENDIQIFENFIQGNDEIVELEKRFLHKNGHAIWTHLHAVCVRDRDGRVKYFATQIQDITEKKKAEAELVTAQAQVQALFENIPSVLIIKDMDLNYTFANATGLKMMKQSLESLKGKKAEDIFPQDIAAEITRVDREVLNTNKMIEYSGTGFDFFYPGEEYSAVHKIVFPIRNSQGEAISLGSISIDLTESKKFETELKKTLQRLTYHVSNTPLAIIELSKDLKIREWSPQAEKLFGWGKDEVLGRTADQVGFVFEEDMQSLTENVIEKLLSGELNREVHHNRNVTKDGQIIDIEWYNSVLVDEEGEVDSILTFALDRTSELKAQNDLLESEQRFDLAVHASKDGIFDHNLLTEKVWYSDNLWLMLGYQPENKLEDMHYQLQDIVHPDEAQDVAESYRQHFKTEQALNYECRVKKMDGTYLWTHTRADSIRDETGRVVRIVGTVSDISERKTAQEEIAHYLEELKRSNNELEQFAYVASHDLQEPLRTIASFTELLGKRYRDQLDEQAKEYIDFTIDGAKRMQGLIKDLLQYSRIGSKEKQFSKVDCNDVFSYVIDDLSITIEENQAEITSDDLPVVYGDELQLSLLFQNLITNAIKYCDGDKQSKVHISVKPEGKYWVFCVKDNGIGISQEFFEKIFVIFQRLHGRSEYSGTGIGLAICKKIIERHGGEIWVNSVPEEGSEFYFTIPVKS